jgi:hypothetical protein
LGRVVAQEGKYGLGYEINDANLFHVLNYSNPITFVSVIFLDYKLQIHTIDDGVEAWKKEIKDKDVNDHVGDDDKVGED